MKETGNPQPRVPRAYRRRRLLSGLGAVLLLPLFLTLVLLGLDTQAGHAWLVRMINRSSAIHIANLEGSLWGRLTLDGLQIDASGWRLNADHLELDWSPRALWQKRLQIASLKAGRVDLAFKPAPPDRPAGVAPQDLRLPLAVVLDKAELASLSLAQPALEVTEVQFSVSSTGQHHRIELSRLILPQGQALARLEFDGTAPFSARGRFEFSGEIEGASLHTEVTLDGALRDLKLLGRVENPKARGEVDARLDVFAPYAYQMLREGRIELRRINPALLLGSLPQAELDIRLDLHPAGEALAQGTLEIINRRPGTADAGQLPLESLQVSLAYIGNDLLLSRLDARLGGGRLQGAGKVGEGRLALDLELAALDLARLWRRQPVTGLGGQVALHGPWLAPDIRIDLTDSRRQVGLKADLGWINPRTERRLQIRELALLRAVGRLNAQGEFNLAGKRDFKLAGEFSRFNPAEYLSLPAGSLSGSFKAEGLLQPRPALSLDYRLADSRFNGEALQGQGRLRLEETRLAEADLWLALGRNRLEARGALGAKNDVLQASLDGPVLSSLGRQFAGSVQGLVRVSGTLNAPVFDGQIRLADLKTPWGWAVKQARLEARLPAGSQAPLWVDMEASQAQQGSWQLDHIRVHAEGSRSQHAATLAVNGSVGGGQALQLQMGVTGGLDGSGRWQGFLQQFNLLGPQPLRLLEAAPLSLSRRESVLGASNWQFGKADLALQAARWQPGQIETRGQFTRLPLADMLQWAGVHGYGSDLALAGRWQVRLDQNRRDLNGQLLLERESGDSLWRGPASNRVPFELKDAQLRLEARHNRIDLNGQMRSSRYGRIELGGTTRVDPVRGLIAEGATLSLHAKGELPDLAAFNPLWGPDLQLGGRVGFDLHREGLRKTTLLAGQVQGEALAIRDLASGLNLKEGTLRMALADQKIQLQQATFKGGQGELRADGVLDLRPETPSAQARIEAQRLTLFSRSDLLLVLSGSGTLSSQKGQIDISGKLRADQGDIEYRSAEMPKLSDDVVIVGRERPKPRLLPALMLSLDIDLGDDFRFRGYGLDAKLNGLLRLRAKAAQPLAANGVVRVKEGTYRAWGQLLEIERGQLSFQGPVDNPGVNILAMRRNQSVEAGVSVLGSAMNPRVQLYSEPSVPDTEKLAWLLFGHGTDGMEKSDSALLLQAAHSLLSGNDSGKSLPGEILGTVGIDDVGMRSKRETDGRSTQIVTVSKQLGRRLRVSLEKSLNGLRDGVQLTWQLGRRWSLVGRVGNDESSAGASYTVQYE